LYEYTKELLEEANKLLASNWEDHEKNLVKRMIDSLVAYKSLIPKSLKNDVKAMLQMANRIKAEYDELLQKYKDEKKENEEQEDNDKQEEKDDKNEIEIIN
jgi:spore cortex formation protein SpoVR/YcgB (stage V sporulation)